MEFINQRCLAGKAQGKPKESPRKSGFRSGVIKRGELENPL